MAAWRKGIDLDIGRRRVDRDDERHIDQRGAGWRVGVCFEMPRAGDAMLLIGEGGVMMGMRSGKDDRDAEVDQRQRQAKNLVTHG